MASKEFTGSWLIVIILLLICWPIAIIYLLIHYEEGSNKYCAGCGAIMPSQYAMCPYCGWTRYAPSPYGANTQTSYAQTPPGTYGQPNYGSGGYAPAGVRTQSKAPKYCGNCGALTDGYVCQKCGTKYEQ